MRSKKAFLKTLSSSLGSVSIGISHSCSDILEASAETLEGEIEGGGDGSLAFLDRGFSRSLVNCPSPLLSFNMVSINTLQDS